ncbi:MAG: HlyD family efflux transporter periplasmic adaptor subunit [Planctomycetota bacterium]|nr:HlyD family efflux transporter periplasmic adaptor subunit [Planctomycetota bacterium]MDA1106291.1 HlyD family efflux transporter periplasmic adaptor subunit [Planctomycetota bacterium]
MEHESDDELEHEPGEGEVIDPAPRRRLPMHSVVFRLLVSFGLIAGSILIVVALIATKEQPPQDDGRSLPRVQVTRVMSVEVPRQWVGFGISTALRASVVPARVSATVLSVPDSTKEGLPVTEGQVIVQLDAEDFVRQREMVDEALKSLDAQITALSIQEDALREQVRLATEDVAISTKDLERFEKAYADGAARIREVDNARTRRIQAERQKVVLAEQLSSTGPKRQQLEAQAASQRSAREIAVNNEARCSVRAPIAGILQQFDLKLGESVMAGQAVARVVDPSAVEVELRLPAQARWSLAVGDVATVMDGGLAGTGAGSGGAGSATAPVTGRVQRIAPEDDPATRTLGAYIEFAGADAKRVPPGAVVEVAVAVGGGGARTIVPRRAIRSDRLHVVEGGQIRAVPITRAFPYRGVLAHSGLPDESWVVIEDGVPGGTVIVLDASSRVAEPGSTIQPVEASERAGS